MPKRFAATKERDAQAALVCGEAFQRLAAEFIPRIGAIKEESAQAMSNEWGDLVACATNLGFAIELYLKALLTHLGLPVLETHDLHDLYNAIPQPVRVLIEDVYDTNQFHQFEYGLLWCAAEAIRVEVTVRLSGMEKAPPTDSLADES